MSAGAPARSRASGARSSPQRDRRPEPREPALLVIGTDARREHVVAALSPLSLRVRAVESVAEALAAVELDAVGIVLAPPLARSGPVASAVGALREDARTRNLPVFVVLADDPGSRSVRRLYEDGVTAVLEWPREALLLPRVVGELLHVAPRPSAPKPADRTLARAARARLQLVEGVDRNLRVSASDGVLHLEGRVASLQVREAIIAFASGIPGVRAIADAGLSVRPSGTPDRTVESRVRELLSDVAEGDTLSISVSDGHVVLMGSVENREAFEQVVSLLSSVRGVRGITNATRESGVHRRRDHRVAASLQRAIEQAHPRAQVRVAVLGEVAVLTGEVDTIATRAAIRRRARGEQEVRRVVDKMHVRV